MTAVAAPPSRVEVAWTPLPGMQTRFLARQEFEVLAGGAAGPGKTDCLVNDLRHFDKPWCKRLFVRRTLPELREVMDRAQKIIPRVFPKAVWNASDKTWLFPSGAKWVFSYTESMKDATRHQGQEYTELFIDELTQIHDEAIYLFLRSRVRSTDPVGRNHLRIRATSNPGGPGHAWVKKRFIDTCGVRGGTFRDAEGMWRAFVPGRLQENPYLPPEYIANLKGLPKILQMQLLDGDWEAGLATAFPDLTIASHVVPAFDIPSHWAQWGGHDWGFRHYAVWVHLAQDEHGRMYVVDTVWGRLKQPDSLAEQAWERIDFTQLNAVFCGPDIRYDQRARVVGESGPTIADIYSAHRIPVTDASISRRAGYSHLLDLLSWRERGRHGTDSEPRLKFMDTPGNQRLVAQLMAMQIDPDDPRDVLKVDCDLVTGVGGDDGYDALRYGTFSRRPAVQAPEKPMESAWAPEALQADAEKRRQPFHPSTVPGESLKRTRKKLDGAGEFGL